MTALDPWLVGNAPDRTLGRHEDDPLGFFLYLSTAPSDVGVLGLLAGRKVVVEDHYTRLDVHHGRLVVTPALLDDQEPCDVDLAEVQRVVFARGQKIRTGRFVVTFVDPDRPDHTIGTLHWAPRKRKSSEERAARSYQWIAEALTARAQHARGEVVRPSDPLAEDRVRAATGARSAMAVTDQGEKLTVELAAWPREVLIGCGAALALFVGGYALAVLSTLVIDGGFGPCALPSTLGMGLGFLTLLYPRRHRLVMDLVGLSVSRYGTTRIRWSEVGAIELRDPGSVPVNGLRQRQLVLHRVDGGELVVAFAIGGRREYYPTEDHLRWLAGEMERRRRLVSSDASEVPEALRALTKLPRGPDLQPAPMRRPVARIPAAAVPVAPPPRPPEDD
ncbi:MAG: hypothetical protein H6735_00670 [Alphaproteobacteria bacterium]|nr:hypothetical protein [Alphaproteobacteria bacterium]